jgi:hypothetical protein
MVPYDTPAAVTIILAPALRGAEPLVAVTMHSAATCPELFISAIFAKIFSIILKGFCFEN